MRSRVAGTCRASSRGASHRAEWTCAPAIHFSTRPRRERDFFFSDAEFNRSGWHRSRCLMRVPRRARRRRRGQARTRGPRPRKGTSRISSLGPRCTSWPPRLSTPGHPFSSRDAQSAPRHRVSTASRPVARGPEPARAGSRARHAKHAHGRVRAEARRPGRTPRWPPSRACVVSKIRDVTMMSWQMEPKRVVVWRESREAEEEDNLLFLISRQTHGTRPSSCDVAQSRVYVV